MFEVANSRKVTGGGFDEDNAVAQLVADLKTGGTLYLARENGYEIEELHSFDYSNKEHAPVLLGKSAAPLMIEGNDNVSAAATTSNKKDFEAKAQVDSDITSDMHLQMKPASSQKNGIKVPIQKEAVTNKAGSNTNYNHKNGSALDKSNSCHQGRTFDGSISDAALKMHRTIENDSSNGGDDGKHCSQSKQMAPIDEKSKGLDSLSPFSSAASEAAAFSNVELPFSTSSKEEKSNKSRQGESEKSAKPFSSIPGPWPSLPFIGTGWQYFYLVGRYDLNKLHEAHIDRYRSYGPIVREEYQWGKSIVHIYDPDDFEAVFRTQGRCPVRPPNEFVSTLRQSKPHIYPNVGFANLNGPEWLQLRQKLAPAIMKLRTINESMVRQNEVCDDFLEYLWTVREEETNTVANLQEASYRLALESICLMCLDSRIGSFPNSSISREDEAVEDGDVLIEATKMMFDSFNKLYYGLPFWKYFATSAYSSLDQAETTIYEIASKYIDKEMDLILNGEEDYDSNESVLKTLLKITKANPEELSKEEVKVTIMDFIIGGIFSVSNSLVYLFYHLAANPDVQEKLYAEIQSVIGSSCKDDQEGQGKERVTSAQLANMAYLKACVSESFRLNCPVPGIMRVTTEPVVLSGYTIPVNTPVFSHCMTTCRLEEYFPQAGRFWPERWIDPALAERNHPFALLPFGFGRRMCVGKRFSENEIYLATVRLLMTYRIELSGPTSEQLELRHAFMVIPANPISLKITRRQ